MASRTLTVVFTDIKGFTARTSKGSRADLIRLLKRHEQLLLPVVSRYGGHVVKTIGDAFLLTFESPTNAVLCGLMMQEVLKEENARTPETDHIEIRVAIHTGEVELIGGDVFGEPVNIAARLEGLASPGDVWFSQTTYGAMQRSEVPTSDVGEFQLKGIPRKITVYKVRFDGNQEVYRRIVEDQRENPPFPESELPEGSFSSNLLFANEQKSLLASRYSRTGPWVLLSAALLILAQLGFYIWQGMEESKAVSEAVALVESGALSEGMDRLERLRETRPNDERIPQSLTSSVNQTIESLQSEARFEEALKTLSAFETRFPYLEIYDTLRRAILLEQSNYRCLDNSEAPGLTFEELVQHYPTDLEIQMHQAHCLAQTGQQHDGLQIYLAVLDKEPAYASDADLRELVLKAIRTWSSPRIQKSLSEHLFDLVGEPLSEALYTSDNALKALRRNAFGVLNIKAPDTVDPLRFWTIEILTREANDTEIKEEMLAFFQGLLASGVNDKLLARVPRVKSEVPILKNHDNQQVDVIVQIFSVFFAEELKLFLRNKLGQTHYSERGYRINARRILEKADLLTPELLMSYHLASLQDHDGYPREHLVESAGWFATDAPRNREAIPHLRIVEQEMIQVIQEWTAGGSAHATGPQKALRNASRSAIKRMGG